MTKKIVFFFILILFIVISYSFSISAQREVEGKLNKASSDYIIVDNKMYKVSVYTVVSEIDNLKNEFPYDPNTIPIGFFVKLIIKNDTVSKILLVVPK